MKKSQIDLLIENNYKIIENRIINTLTDNPPIKILFDNEIQQFYFVIDYLKIYEYDFEDFINLFIKLKKLVNELNKL